MKKILLTPQLMIRSQQLHPPPYNLFPSHWHPPQQRTAMGLLLVSLGLPRHYQNPSQFLSCPLTAMPCLYPRMHCGTSFSGCIMTTRNSLKSSKCLPHSSNLRTHIVRFANEHYPSQTHSWPIRRRNRRENPSNCDRTSSQCLNLRKILINMKQNNARRRKSKPRSKPRKRLMTALDLLESSTTSQRKPLMPYLLIDSRMILSPLLALWGFLERGPLQLSLRESRSTLPTHLMRIWPTTHDFQLCLAMAERARETPHQQPTNNPIQLPSMPHPSKFHLFRHYLLIALIVLLASIQMAIKYLTILLYIQLATTYQHLSKFPDILHHTSIKFICLLLMDHIVLILI